MTLQLQATAAVSTTNEPSSRTESQRGPITTSSSGADKNTAMAPFAEVLRQQDATPKAEPAPTRRDEENTEAQESTIVSANGALVTREAPAEKGVAREASTSSKGKAAAGGLQAASNALASTATDLLVERSTPAGEDPGAMKLLLSKDQDGAGAKTAVQSIVDDGALASHSQPEAAGDIASKAQTTPVAPAADATPAADANIARVPVPLDATRVPAAALPNAAAALPTAALPRAMAAVQQALAQEGVNLKMLGDGARLTMQMQDGTELAVRLLMRDGAVEVRAAGMASTLLEGKAPELRAALSAEGLKLGSFQTRTGHGSGGNADDNPVFDDDGRSPTSLGTSVASKGGHTRGRRLQTSNRSVVA